NFPALPNGLVWTIAYNPTSVVLGVSTPAAGCAPGTNQWTGATSNQWNVATNWSNGIPISTDNVCVGSAFTSSTITIGSLATANQPIAGLTSNAALNFTAGPLTITGSATFANTLNVSSGSLALSAGAQAAGVNISGGTLTTNGALTLSGSS